MKFTMHQLLVSCFLTGLLSLSLALPTAQAQTTKKKKKKTATTASSTATTSTRKKTVGELLSQATEPSRGAGVKLAATKSDTALPSASLGFQQRQNDVNLDAVKPPRSSELLKNENADQAEYEKILDQQIQELYKLTQRFKGSDNRGELWLRLAELYVEKSTLIDTRKQNEYDQKLRAFTAGQTKARPKLDQESAREYNRKAVQLYEWFQRDFPQDEKMSQALFFLGYNYFELGEVKKGAHFYEELTKRYPTSAFVGEAYFALGEYHFENEQWANAYKNYSYLIKDRKHRLHTFSLYKGAWCLFRLGKSKQALSYLEYIIKSGRNETGQQLASRRTVNRNRLESEALRDIVVFYAEAGDPTQASNYFKGLVGGDVTPYLEKLAYYYADKGNKDASREVFRLLIADRPTHPKAFEYQYQIVQNYYYAKNTSKFKDELYRWVKEYGPGGAWYEANKGNKELLDNAYKLRETTLRNYILQQHQTAQNSRAAFSQTAANDGYQLYLASFGDSANAGDMRFYYGELLYDMGKFDDASVQYKWVVDNSQQSKFYPKAAQNLLLSVERSVPTDQELLKKVGNSLDPIPLEPKVERFVKAGQWYTDKFPNSDKNAEIRFRIGRLYYQSNHFDEATQAFKGIVQKYPNTKYAEYSANLLLDIYNLRKDYVGLEKAGAELLAVPSIASSKAGADIRGVMEKSSFKRGQDLETEKKYAESAQVYSAFAKQNPKSPLALTANFNAGVNFERSGQNGNAIQSYRAVLADEGKEHQDIKWKAKRLLAKQYQDSSQFEEAAKLYRQAADERPTDPLAPNLMNNAAVLYAALGKNDAAIKAYSDFSKLNKHKYQDNVDAIYSIATIYRKAGQNGAAIAKYKEYLEAGPQDKEKTVEATYQIADLSSKQHHKDADEWKKKTLAVQKRFAPDRKGIGAEYAAKIKLEESMKTFAEMKSVHFPKDASKQKAAADRKISLLTRLNGELSEVIKFDSAEEVVSALELLGEANLNMGQEILNAPIPAGLNPEESKQYKAGVDKFAEPFMSKTKDSFKAAVERGWELQVYNDAYHKAFEYMNKQNPEVYYDHGEVGSDIRLVNWMSP